MAAMRQAPLESPLSSRATNCVGTVLPLRKAGVPNSPKERNATTKKLSKKLGLRRTESMFLNEYLALNPRVLETLEKASGIPRIAERSTRTATGMNLAVFARMARTSGLMNGNSFPIREKPIPSIAAPNVSGRNASVVGKAFRAIAKLSLLERNVQISAAVTEMIALYSRPLVPSAFIDPNRFEIEDIVEPERILIAKMTKGEMKIARAIRR